MELPLAEVSEILVSERLGSIQGSMQGSQLSDATAQIGILHKYVPGAGGLGQEGLEAAECNSWAKGSKNYLNT